MNESSLQLSSFFEGLNSGLASYRQIRSTYNRKIAFDFNSIQFFHIGENKTSDILAFFLDPDANHGQGDSFLRTFLDIVSKGTNIVTPKTIYKVSTITEHRTDENRRIDIVIAINDGEFVVGIENKVGTATDQPKQLEDYAKYLQKIALSNFLLLYLTSEGLDASEVSMNKCEREELQKVGSLKNISYSDTIIPIFESFTNICEADNVRAFLKDFTCYLKKHFRGERIMSESNYIQDYVKQNPQHQNIALEVAFSRYEILDPLLKSLADELRAYLRKAYPSSQYKLTVIQSSAELLNSRKYVNLLTLRRENWSKTCIAYQFDGTRAKGLCYGVVHDNHNGKFNSVKTSLGFSETLFSWAFYNWHSFSDWNSDPKVWSMMIKPPSGHSKLFELLKGEIDPIIDALNAMKGVEL